jgi:very-short-patch-repair endonuclease
VIPSELNTRPFTLDEARAAGLTRRVLAGKAWRRIGSSIYCRAGLPEEPWQVLHAWHRRLPGAVFTGLSAAWLHRLDVDPIHPVEVAVPTTSGVRSRPGLIVRRRTMDAAIKIRGLPATNVHATLADLCRTLPSVEALVVLDEAARKGLGRINTALGLLAEPAESRMETRLRWLLIEGGLPRPEVQVRLHDHVGGFVGRADLYYRASRLVIEYDGTNHRDRLIEDNRRQNLLVRAGYRLLRFTAADVLRRPASVVALVRDEVLLKPDRVRLP